MAVMMILDWQGVTVEQYEQVNEAMGVLTDEDAPAGLIEHTAAVSGDGSLVIVDLWESQEALDRFFEERLGPAIEQVGIEPAEPRLLPVHNTLEGSAPEGNVLMLIEIDDGTDTYDAMTADMDAHASPGTHPVHLHAVATDGASLVVADLWASEQEFGQFAQEQIAPAAEKHGMGAMRQSSHTVHNRIRGRSTATT
jgi:hypothetical protein